MDQVLSLLCVPPPPDLPVYGGEGVSVGPAVCYGPGAISMKEDWVQGAPLHSHTEISDAGSRDNSRRRAYKCANVRQPISASLCQLHLLVHSLAKAFLSQLHRLCKYKNQSQIE